MRTLSILLCGFLFAPVTALAHGDGLSFERKVGTILIDIGYGNTQPSKGATLTYSFDLFNNVNPNTPLFEPFTQVDIRLFRGRDSVLEKTLKNDGTNIPSLSYTFSEAGNYTLAASYVRPGKDAVSSTFGFAVAETAASSSRISSRPSTSASSVATGTNTTTSFAIDPAVAAAIAGAVVLLILARIAMLFGKKKRR